MRHDKEDARDDEMRETFRRARVAERGEAPAYRDLVRARPQKAPRTGRPLVWAAVVAAGLTLAVASVWLPLWREESAPLRTPEASRQPPTEAEVPVVTVEEIPQVAVAAEPATEPAPIATGKTESVEKSVEDALKSLGYVASAPIATDIVIVKKYVPPKGIIDQKESATKLDENFIDDLPVPGRSYQNTLTLAPGVQDAGGDGNPNVHGSRSKRDFAAIIGGVSNVDPLSARQLTEASPNSIEEMEVIRGGAGAEFGRAQGGFANIIQAHQKASKRKGTPDPPPEFNTESYAPIQENECQSVLDHPLSTFSIDVDTASYANVRRFLREGRRPPPDAVRIEEMVNYFSYDYPPPSGAAPFSATVEIADCPWAPGHRLARIGLKGREASRGAEGGSNLVFLIDVSGSMAQPNKLPLVQQALTLLADQLDGRDQVAIVVYAGASGLVLPSTSGARRGDIREAVQRLSAGGGTNGASGLRLAYQVARENFIEGGVNRVILATDGDFNLGVTSKGELLQIIEADARDGVFLTALGFGMGNYKDDTLETLADKGNGNYAYIDDLREARKVLVEQIGGTLITIAKDVKIQVEFNPTKVGAYRLIGYENRMLRKEDFNDDRKDAGEIGAGHTVTALYELFPPGEETALPQVGPLRYQTPASTSQAARSEETFTLKLRYKEPDGRASKLVTFPIVDDGLGLGAASADFKFAAAVAEFGMLLRGSSLAPDTSLEQVRRLALEGQGADEGGYRAEFLELVSREAR